jgi:hypothetical protein
MYRFREGKADQYMTRAVTTVTRQTTMSELAVLFENHDFVARAEAPTRSKLVEQRGAGMVPSGGTKC